MEFTNPDRVMFPGDGITKGDVVDYYSRVADRMLGFIAERALSVERFPRGIGEAGFMQKNTPGHYPRDLIGRHSVPKEGGGSTLYPVLGSVEGILYLANLGVITFHVPPVTVHDELHPDWAVWDLDPPPGRADLARRAASALRSVLDDHGIPTLLLASGSKGYHLRCRLEPALTVDEVARIARGLAALAAALHPDLMTVTFRRAERGERVFVDWLRNTPLSTSVAPWSLRPRPGAPVAAPLRWAELELVAPDGIGLHDADQRPGSTSWMNPTPLDLTSAAEAVDRSLERAGIELEPFDRFRS